MLLNKKAVKKFYHEQGKRVSEEAMEVINRKLQVFLSRSIQASKHFKTIKAQDVCLFQIRIGD
ncbi:MAG: hypothetical protein PHQ54_00015 [Candidatus Omnitrophica bacterium]|nr:hypothetical protein [Candidatus Omnitrophota bacterium]